MKILQILFIFIVAFIFQGCESNKAFEGTFDPDNDSDTYENVSCDPTEMVLATTTSTDNTGLLDYLLPVFEEEYCVEVSVVAVGTGAALELGMTGDADSLLVHATELENEFVDHGYGYERHDVMFNDFVILGLTAIEVPTLKEAFDYLYTEGEAGNLVFYSRGDHSGTDVKEKSLWSEYGYDVSTFGEWYQETGKGMGDTLVMTDASEDYTFSDRGTYLATKENLVVTKIAFESPAELKNQYGVVLINSDMFEINADDGEAFYNWILSEEAQTLIDEYQFYGEQLFFSNAN